ncbi:MAG: hypothetical protein ABIE07_02055 [Candidatus Zixiibacteriota bacterium]
MSYSISYNKIDGNTKGTRYTEKPDFCPVCKKGIDALPINAFESPFGDSNSNICIIFQCPRNKCFSPFLAYYFKYRVTDDIFHLSRTLTNRYFEVKIFSDIIKNISKLFPRIYNESLIAEENGLDTICGPGFRKSLEFLVKDYLVHKKPGDKDKICNSFLGTCIKDINNEQIREMAKRAAWIGNDETHYIREWDDKDIKNLKDLIDVVVSWIELEEKSKKYIDEMPDEST